MAAYAALHGGGGGPLVVATNAVGDADTHGRACLAEADELGIEVAAFAEAVLPRACHRKAKRQLLERLEQIAREVLDPEAKVFGFGSSLNGCGEASSDIDLVVYVSPETATDVGEQEALCRVAEAAEEAGVFHLLEMRPRASVPIVTLEMLDDKLGGTGYTCDVSFQRTLPLHNTRLLRTYVELMPELAPLIVVVKRWAKSAGIAGTYEHFISTYSWTLVVLYYCQVVHGLPSLHALAARERPVGARRGAHRRDLEGEGQLPAHDVNFVGLAAARRLLGRAQLPEAGLGRLLRGFFEFYVQEYDWRDEVVSVRLGTREWLDSPKFSSQLTRTTVRKKGRRRVMPTFRYFNIEDPIETERNLNFALRNHNMKRIHSALAEAHIRFCAGAGLPEILGMEELPHPQPRTGRRAKQPWLSGFLAAGRRPPCQCGTCGRRFQDFGVMLDHERSCTILGRLLLKITQS